ncbi:MAG: heavy metal translocating P-type ATPase, partial [Bacilli bacterium]
DIILIKPGERIPSDAEILTGRSTVDQAAITGESMPISVRTGTNIYAGTLNITGVLTARVTKLQNETLVSKIITLVQNAQSEKSPAQQTIEKYESTYVYSVLFITLAVAIGGPLLFDMSWESSVYRAAILLVVASPCALVASIMPATLAAITSGAKRGILVKGGVHFEQLRTVSAVAFDKTGTLTKGKPTVQHVWLAPEYDRLSELRTIAGMEQQSNHPLATAIVSYILDNNPSLVLPTVTSVQDEAGHGIHSTFGEHTYRIGKRSFAISSKQLPQEVEDLVNSSATLVYVSKNDELIALFSLADEVRSEAHAALQTLHDMGIQSIMLTGDRNSTAQQIALQTGVKTWKAELLPHEKVESLITFQKQYGNVAMVGDGINDAPALATANVGIAMGEGSDVALDTADVVLMKNELHRIPEAIELSRRLGKITKQNMIISVGMIVTLILMNLSGNIEMPLGVVGHEGSTILVILNGLRLLK